VAGIYWSHLFLLRGKHVNHPIKNRRRFSDGVDVVFVLAVAMVGGLLPAAGQELRGVSAEGYITATQTPDGFDVNGRHVLLTSQTKYVLAGDKSSVATGSLSDAMQIGAYVAVVGRSTGKTKPVTAKSVYLRDDLDESLSGLGVIERVSGSGAEPEFEADGYRIRIPVGVATSFRGDVKSMADVGPNTWIRYEGKRDADGVLVASKAKFMQVKAKLPKTVDGLESFDMLLEKPDLGAHKDGKVRLFAVGGWRKIPADRALQERVARVGASVLPAYQRAMAEDNPYKVHIAFYAIDDTKLLTDYCSMKGGLILVSRQLVERMANDSQLAAVLADGVAYLVQRQGVKQLTGERVILGEAAASVALAAFDPGAAVLLALNGAASGAVPGSKAWILLQRQRGRVALELLAEAGYDPWQAPEAWRLAEPKALPKDLGTLPYPDRSGYQLGILNLQYGRNAAGKGASGSDGSGQSKAKLPSW